jgi:hypothetical protein
MIKFNHREQLETNPDYEHNFVRNKNTPMFYVIDKAVVENIVNNVDTGKDYANVALYSGDIKVDMKNDYELVNFDITKAKTVSAINGLAEKYLVDNHPDFAGGVIA